MSTFGSRLREERKKMGLSQTAFADLAELRKQSQVHYETGKRYPDGKYLIDIAEHGADVTYIITGVRSLSGTPAHTAKLASELLIKVQGQDFEPIPRYDVFLAAGNGSLNDNDEPVEHLAFSKAWLNKMGITSGMAALLSVKGDSMAPTLHDGDIVMVDREKYEITSGRIYAFQDGDDGARVKRLEVIPNTAIIIRSDNPDEPVEYRKEVEMNQISENIIGEVIWSGHSWK